jgi:hypothetical protein
VIRVAWMPVLARSRRRGPQLVRVRRRPLRKRRHHGAGDVRSAAVSWDGEPAPRAPLPIATLVRGAGTAQALVGELRGWLAGQAAWLRPRAIPMAVAFAGMLAVLASVSYLNSMNVGKHAEQHAQAMRPTTIVLEPAAAYGVHVLP